MSIGAKDAIITVLMKTVNQHVQWVGQIHTLSCMEIELPAVSQLLF